jgi:hypothetical protein
MEGEKEGGERERRREKGRKERRKEGKIEIIQVLNIKRLSILLRGTISLDSS